MKTLILTTASLFFFVPIIGNTSEDISPAFIDGRKDRGNSRAPDNFKKDFRANNLLKEITKSGEMANYCNGVKCLPSSKARKLAVNGGFTSTFYYKDDLPGLKGAGFPVE